MPRGRVKVAFIGAGSMGQCAHLKNYAALDECEVVALAELRGDVREKVAARYGVPAVYENHEELIAEEQFDALVCIQPFSRHGILIPEVLKAGVPLLIEKPLASSVRVGERILDALERSRTFMMVAYHKRSDPATECAKAEIDRLKESGEAGRMRYVRITMPPGDWIAGGFNDLIRGGEVTGLETDPPPPDMDEETFRKYKTFVNYYIHQVNLMRHLLGESYRVTYAEKSQALLAVESIGGVAGVIEMAPYSTSLGWRESALVGFERGYVKLDLPAPLACNRAGRVEIMRDAGDGKTPETVVPVMPPVGAMRRQAENFLKAVRGEAKPPCGAEEALEDLRVARDYISLLQEQG